MSEAQTYTADDLNDLDADALENLSSAQVADDIDPDELTFPSYRHHMKVRQKLEQLADLGVIGERDVEERYDEWLNGR